jgi:MFS transporter, PAT family, beta-lactamase induction signal transducer AmpG
MNPMQSKGSPTHLGLLFALYFVQGMPFGFQTSALGTYLRAQGTSRTEISLMGLLSLPWMLKLFVAPLVDRHGTRTQWILPLQAVSTCIAAGAWVFFDPSAPVRGMLVAVLGMNVCAAVMDIAVDGWAVDLLAEDELGRGNAVQVVGAKCGMLAGGGLFPWLVGRSGPRDVFLAMALTLAVVCIGTWLAAPSSRRAQRSAHERSDVLRTLLSSVRVPGALATLAIVLTYKCGESLIDPMFNPFLVDEGYAPSDIQLWTSTFGMAGSIAGSVAGGELCTKWGIDKSLMIAAALRAIPLVGVVGLAALGSSASSVLAVTLSEHVFGGLLTTVMFAFMMSRVDGRIGASHFTLLATAELLGKSGFALASGAVTDASSPLTVFALGLSLSIAWALALPFALRRARKSFRADST